MSWGAGSKVWFIAASVGAVEGSKDQEFCRCSHALRSLDQRAKNNLGSYSQAKKLSSSSSIVPSKVRDEEAKQAEESLRKVMYLTVGVLTDTEDPFYF
ncbi:hypothetical protein F3Y22_tig00111833pilonHSYRG00049 [Hibiscus syriacus]|uniref:Uncharacterized protein n=1 Tax=Hibiscus syriacus TaxID=106335 RepID=A0A6A2YCG8_HIBSY|nr:hypothetical protein F3Y22_tig00111833pilonHSYRG00049 [Hibiscus syriacus]